MLKTNQELNCSSEEIAMVRKQERTSSISSILFSLAMALLLTSCGIGDGLDITSSATTTISGKVTLSSTVTAKPAMMAATLAKARQQPGAYKPGASEGSNLMATLSATKLGAPAVALQTATIELYDADKAEWLLPVASASTNPDGTYTLGTLINAASNLNPDGTAAYVNGKPLPSGNYTVIVSKYDTFYGKLLVAVQAIVKKFSGQVIGNDLVAQDSDAVPAVSSMLGLAKNSDGTFGSSTSPVPANANIQVIFSMAMDRKSVMNAMKIVPAGDTVPITGKWKISADLTAATFYPTNPLKPNTVYTITIGGGKSLKTASNVYGVAMTADVTGTFRSAPKDVTPPTALRNSPAGNQKAKMPIMTPIRIASDEELDITSINVDSSPSIGDKPTIKYVGRSNAQADAAYPFVYEVSPSSALQLGTTYTLTVSGGLDMVGLPMDVLTTSFTTEPTSLGISTLVPGTNDTEVNTQLSVKHVLGKWVNAMNSRNSALLISYMSGDFFWVNDSSRGMSSDDLNRDGRLSLNEFTAMLNNWFKDLDRCGSKVTGEVDVANISIPGGITVSGSTASIAFTITATPTNKTDPTCNSGPNNTLYAVMENINQGWLMTRGSEVPPGTIPTLAVIDLISPANGNQYPEPTRIAPLKPEFKWTAVASDTIGTPMPTYLVVLIDNNSRQMRTGWAALVDGSNASVGSPVSAKFASSGAAPGGGGGGVLDLGNMLVLDLSQKNPLGFEKMITQIQPGGSYTWAVVGFKTKTLDDFKILNFDPAVYLAAASTNNGFTVGGTWKELTIKLTDLAGTTVYDYSDSLNGYFVGSASSVLATVTTPNSSATSGYVSVSGYTSSNPTLTFSAVGSSATGTATINLSNKRNSVYLGDNAGLYTDFSILTTGGAQPLISITSITPRNCAGVITTSFAGPDAWENYNSSDVCTLDIVIKPDPTLTGTLSLNVWNNEGKGYYNNSVDLVAGPTYTFTAVPVFQGQNWVQLGNWGTVSSQNGFGVNTTAGTVFNLPIKSTSIVDTATGTAISALPSNIWQEYWDAGIATSVTINLAMPGNTTFGTYSTYAEPGWTPHLSNQPLVGTNPSIVGLALYKGWNYIQLSDGLNWYSLSIYAKNGTPYVPPHAVTIISDGTTPLPITTPSMNYYQYPSTGSTAACSVTITGTTTNAGNLYVYLNSYNSTNGASVYENQTVTPVFNGATSVYDYTITQSVYAGTNTIDIYDAMWIRQGVQVSSTCPTPPIVFGVTGVTDVSANPISKDIYGTYQATVPTVRVSGGAKTGRTVTAYISGMYYGTVSTVAAGNTYSIDLPVYTGYNYISLTDGSNWTYLTVNTTNGTVWVPPINAVTVSGSTLASGGQASDSWSSWSTGLGTVNIAGNSTVSGTGYYYQSGALYASGTFTSGGGTFSLTGVALGYGYNYFTLYDANWNSYNLTIYTSGGIGAPPKIVAITSPAQGASASGSTAVSGTIDTASFTPVYVYGYAYDYITGLSTYYSNQSADSTWAQPLTYDVATGNFSFSASVTNPNTTYISAYAYDASWISHGHSIYLNNAAGYTEYFYKPGTKPSAGDGRAKAHQTEFLKKMMRR